LKRQPRSFHACRGVRTRSQQLRPLLLGEYSSGDLARAFLPHRGLGDDDLPTPVGLFERDGSLIELGGSNVLPLQVAGKGRRPVPEVRRDYRAVRSGCHQLAGRSELDRGDPAIMIPERLRDLTGRGARHYDGVAGSDGELRAVWAEIGHGWRGRISR